MKIERIAERILFVRFKNEEAMVKAILRIAEYSENAHRFETHSPTFGQFIKWYKENKEPKTPYASYFYGVNLTGTQIKHFVMAYPRARQLNKEQEFLDAIKSCLGVRTLKQARKYSVILCPGTKKSSVFHHELAHAVYYINATYRAMVDREVSKLNKHELDRMRQYLLTQDYSDTAENPEIYTEVNSRLIEKVSLKRLFGGANIRISSRQRQKLRDLQG